MGDTPAATLHLFVASVGELVLMNARLPQAELGLKYLELCF